jgi:predicted permease
MESLVFSELAYILFAICAVLVVFAVSIPAACAVTKRKEARGVLLQATFRSNFALVGLPLAQSLFGNEGLIVASLMSAVVIPVYNILAVISLSIFGCNSKKASVKGILLDIVKNPLIQSIVLGLLCLCIRSIFVNVGIEFRFSDITPVYTVLENLSKVATPLALVALGAQFDFKAITAMKSEIIFGTAMRTVIVPTFALGTALMFFGKIFNGAHFAALIALFATPVAVLSVPMTQEMGSDSELAGQIVVWTTIISAFSVFVATFIFKYIGVL